MRHSPRESEGQETAHVFRCRGARLVGILHRPAQSRPLGVLVVVGGPQYRVGSHRHFVELARALSAQGVPVFRFDYRGIGDSEGDYPGFENVGPDIGSALATFKGELPSLRGVVLWGLCDAVPPIAAAACSDAVIKGVMLVNPWAREETSYDETLLRHYYTRRLLQAEFWRNLARGRTQVRDFPRLVLRVLRRKLTLGRAPQAASDTLAARTVRALARFEGAILLTMSGHDLTAREFDQEAAKVAAWQDICASPRFDRRDLPEADHTFSEAQARSDLNQATLDWLDQLERALFESGDQADGRRTPAAGVPAQRGADR